MEHCHVNFQNAPVSFFKVDKKVKYPKVQKRVTFWVPVKLETLDDVALSANVPPSFDFLEVRLHCDVLEVHHRGECLDVCIVGTCCVEQLQVATAEGGGVCMIR